MSATIVEFAIPLVLIVLDYAFNRSGLIEAVEVRTIFNPTREDSLSNWVSSLQELAIGVVAALIYAHGRITQSGSPWMRRGWLFIALLFAYVSIDDGMSVHERVGTALANWNPDGVVDLYPSTRGSSSSSRCLGQQDSSCCSCCTGNCRGGSCCSSVWVSG